MGKITSSAQASALGAKGHTPEAERKRRQTNNDSRLVKGIVYAGLRDQLLAEQKNGGFYYDTFLKNYLKEAIDDPNSRAAQVVAETILKENILSSLDEATEKMLTRDLDYARYRIIKELYREERELLYDTQTYGKVAACTSRRCGKSYTSDAIAVYTALKPKRNILIVGLTFSAVMKQHFDVILSFADKCGLMVSRSSKSEGMIEFYNGSTIQLTGCPNKEAPDKLRGDALHLAIIDEAGHQKYALRYMVEEVIQPMLNFDDSRLLMIGTPSRVPHSYFEACYKNKAFKQVHWTARENPYIKDFDKMIDEVCQQKGVNKNDPLIQREYEGLWSYDTEAQVYHDYKTYTELPSTFSADRVYIGIDWGHGDSNAIVTTAANMSKKVGYVIQETKFAGADTDEQQMKVYEAINYAHSKYPLATIKVVSDTNEPSLVQTINKNLRKDPKYANIQVEKAYKCEKMLQLSETATACRNGTIYIPANGILEDEFKQILYLRDEETDAILPEIDEDLYHGDANMALQYGVRNMLMEFDYSKKIEKHTEIIENGPVKYIVLDDEEDNGNISQTDGGMIG